MTKAQYAVGYFTEMGIGCRRDPLEANVWYVKAADQGDQRATQRLAAIRAAASGGVVTQKLAEKEKPRKLVSAHGAGEDKGEKHAKSGKDDRECVVM